MYEVRKTEIFEKWFKGIKDRRAKARVQVRIDRMQLGHFGDSKSVGDQIRELRIFYGPGYRVYFTRRAGELILLSIGGTKSSQSKDIALAKEIAQKLEV